MNHFEIHIFKKKNHSFQLQDEHASEISGYGVHQTIVSVIERQVSLMANTFIEPNCNQVLIIKKLNFEFQVK